MVTSYYKDSATLQQGLDLKHIDPQGNVLLSRRFLFPNMDFGSFNNAVFQENISSQNAILTGATYIGTNSAVVFLSINKTTLDTNWVRSYSNGAFGFNLNTTLKIQANEFWLFGSRSLNASYGTRPYAIKIDTLGNIIGVKEFNTLVKYLPKTSYYDPITEKIFCSGTNVNNSSDFNTFVVCIDTIGNICWDTEFTSNAYNPFFNKIEKKNSYLVLCGSEGEFMYGGFEQKRLNILKINSNNGSIIWNKKYFGSFFTNYLASVVINSDESITATGSAGFFNPVVDYNNDGIILKVNSAGDSLWMQGFGNYGQGTMEIFYDLMKTSEGGYLLCGLSNNTLTLHTWLVKTDSLGNGPGKTTGVKKETSSEKSIKIYPQPANDKLILELTGNNFNGPRKIKVFNCSGDLIFEEEITFSDSKAVINVSNFKDGLYLLTIINQDNQIFNQKVFISK